MRNLRFHGNSYQLQPNWSDLRQEGLYLQVKSEDALEAHVVVAAEGTGSLVAAATLGIHGRTAELTINTLSSSPEVLEFYSFPERQVAFYTETSDDLVKSPRNPCEWIQSALERLEAFHARERSEWATLRRKARRFLEKSE